MDNGCKYCGKRQYSAWDHILNKPRHDRVMARIKKDEERMEKNYKRIMENYEKLQAAAKESDEALIRAIEELDGDE